MGVYIWGDVGRGKSMIMDFFFNHTHNIPKKRSHFHQFMVEFHKSIIKWHSKNDVSQNNAISDVAENIAKNVKVVYLKKESFYLSPLTSGLKIYLRMAFNVKTFFLVFN